MSMIEYAQKEWERAFPDKDDEMQEMAKSNVFELLETFSKQGHSGFSGNYVLHIFNRLVHFKPLRPLTGEEDEWGEPYSDACGDVTQQNKRYGAVFRKNHDNATAYDIEGRVFVDEDGFSYTNCDSNVPVTFPYTVPDRPEIIHISKKTGEQV